MSVILVVSVCVVLMTMFYIYIYIWNRKRERDLLAGGKIAITTNGPIEYQIIGDGVPLLYFHGGLGGYDQGLHGVREAGLPEAGFMCITPSRPGYLGTPLQTGKTAEEAADACAELLDQLGIKRVCIMGGSGGGRTAIQFALRHPDRTNCMVLFSAITHQYKTPIKSAKSLIVKIYLTTILLDLLSWVSIIVAKYFTGIFATILLKGSTSESSEQVSSLAKSIANNPEKVQTLISFSNVMAPLAIRHKGAQNDIVDDVITEKEYDYSKISAPTLIQHSIYDLNVPFEHAEYIYKAVSKSRLSIYNECGHMFFIGPKGEESYAEVVSFCKENSRT